MILQMHLKYIERSTLNKLFPLVSEHFNIFLEIPLKIITRNFSYKIIPISWTGRKKGTSKFRIKELGSMYLFTLLYCLFEKILLRKNDI
jgi:dolichol-phosphate mannosyltransferase